MASVEEKVVTTPEQTSSASLDEKDAGSAKGMPSRPTRCQAVGCKNAGKMQCPTCLQSKMPPTFFCSQDCFKREWKTHNQTHKDFKAFVPKFFNYTGPLRPHYVTPMRWVPDDIPKPEYSLSGLPVSEQTARANNTIPIYDKDQIRGIRAACKIGREVLDIAARMVKPGVTTEEIDRVVHDETIARGAYPSPLNYHNFPKSCCTSVNEIICHGIPDCRPLEDGDIVNLDISVYYRGFHGDLNETYTVGNVEKKYKDLIKCTYDATMKAIETVKPNALIRDIGNVIQGHVSKSGYSVVRTYCGHGIGELFHCAPNVPHYNKNKATGVMKPGMVFTIEPMINMGKWQDLTWPDDWTSSTIDGERSAQFEHTVLVTQNGVEILSARTKDSVPFWWEVDAAKPSA